MSSARRATCAISSAITPRSTKNGPLSSGEQGLEPLPASTGIQAILCRPELLVEIEAIAMFIPAKEE